MARKSSRPPRPAKRHLVPARHSMLQPRRLPRRRPNPFKVFWVHGRFEG